MDVDQLAKLIEEKIDGVCAVCRERSGNIRDNQEDISKKLDRIEAKVDKANGRSRWNSWNVKFLWAVLGGAWTVFLIWFKEVFLSSH